MTDTPKGRAYEKTFEVHAPADAVWNALTRGEELTRWFVESAETEEGVGGIQTVDFGGGMKGSATITIWEPGKHLRTEISSEESAARGLASDAPYATDWFLEHANGVTKVRMVASGFGEGEQWDAEYNGTHSGWDMYHRNLRHYLEVHPGKAAESITLMAMLAIPPAEAWGLLFGPQGLCTEGSLTEVTTGGAFDFTAASGDRFSGTATIIKPPKTFHAVLESHNQGLWNVELAEMGGAGFLWTALLLWDTPPEEVAALRERLTGLISTLFPPPAAE